jgi:hypothetical protein
LPIFVRPSTICATSSPNSCAMSATVIAVSSTTSWISPAATVTLSSCRSARIFATSTQCETYGSPEERVCPSWARSL